ncbi:MAG TPA: hypothetical protein VFQ07_01555, partial [Candidatus Polarisedimenticolia bacterium]|nr:hypothetical protein [Candidatus Polarisedimenticolia bacterium]
MARGIWTAPLRLSEENIDSRSPVALLNGDDIRVTYETPEGSISRTMTTTFLAESAVNLMDSPIPPGYIAVPSDKGNPSDEPPGDKHVFRK